MLRTQQTARNSLQGETEQYLSNRADKAELATLDIPVRVELQLQRQIFNKIEERARQPTRRET